MHTTVLKLFSLRSFLISLSFVIVFSALFSFGPGVSKASAACQSVWSTPGGAGDHQGWTIRYTVPSNSTCNDINLSNINIPGTNITCGTFFVRFYPSSGGFYDGAPKYLCSSGNTLKVLATDVLNGTRYDVNYYWRNGYVGTHYHFKITH
jgi:hypothetical protein